MSLERMIDLYQLLNNNSQLSARGLAFQFDGEHIRIRQANELIGKWTYEQEHFHFTRPACQVNRVTVETVTQVLAYVTNTFEAK